MQSMKKVLSILLQSLPQANGTATQPANASTASDDAARAFDDAAVPLLRNLARWAYRFTPVVAYDRPPLAVARALGDKRDLRYFGVNLDVTGCDRLFGSGEKLLTQIRRELDALGVSARIALAPSLGAAWALSRYGDEPRPLLCGEDRSVKALLDPLPITSLRLSPRTVTALEEVEIRRIRELRNVPRPALLARFNHEVLEQLDRALGTRSEPLDAIRFVSSFRKDFVFDGPILELESIRRALIRTAEALTIRLERASQRARVLVLETFARDVPPQRKELTLSRPSVCASHIVDLFLPHIESLHLGNGVERLKLTASHVERAVPETVVSDSLANLQDDRRSHQRNFGELVDVLCEQLGKDRVLALRCHESHVPERSFDFVPVLQPRVDSYERSRLPALPERERPSVLFHHPRSIRAMATVPDGPPFSIEWQKRRYRVVACAGPERIAPEWWGPDAALCRTRDYFRVLLAPVAGRPADDQPELGRPPAELAAEALSPGGCWLWIYRELEQGGWFVHGIWT